MVTNDDVILLRYVVLKVLVFPYIYVRILNSVFCIVAGHIRKFVHASFAVDGTNCKPLWCRN